VIGLTETMARTLVWERIRAARDHGEEYRRWCSRECLRGTRDG